MKKLWILAALLLSLASYACMTLTQNVTLADGRTILAASNGLTLYTFDEDDENVSNCFDRCLSAWPAFTTELSELPAPFGIHVRTDDGTHQVTLNGQPLYFFVGDQAQGEVNGDGLGGVWHLIDGLPLY